MSSSDTTEDFDALIDKAVDTFFVEAPSEEEMAAEELDFDQGFEAPESKIDRPEPQAAAPPPPPPPPPSSASSEPPPDGFGPSLDEAVESLFGPMPGEPQESAPPASAPQPPPAPEPPPAAARPVDEDTPELEFDPDFTATITSGDDETDQAIDLAVDTLFVEEPDTPAPETTEIEAHVARAPSQELETAHIETADITPEPPAPPPPPQPPQPEPEAEPSKSVADLFLEDFAAPEPEAKPEPDRGERPGDQYDDMMAQEIERHMHSLFEAEADADTPTLPAEEPSIPAPKPKAPPKPAAKPRVQAPPKPRPKRKKAPETERKHSPLRQLREAILTLEWEISNRSVSTLAAELRKVRTTFADNMTVDFAAVSMRLVLNYLIKRMSKAHPESVRFLIEVVDYLDHSLTSSEQDPLGAFHYILNRYETYKSVIRKAEGLVDKEPDILKHLEIKDPEAFSRTVENQGKTLIRAGISLGKRLQTAEDPQNLIRSFRFLVNRSVNRILDSTQKNDEAAASGQAAILKKKKKKSKKR